MESPRRAGVSAWHTSSRRRGSPFKQKTSRCPTSWSTSALESGETLLKYFVPFISHLTSHFQYSILRGDIKINVLYINYRHNLLSLYTSICHSKLQSISITHMHVCEVQAYSSMLMESRVTFCSLQTTSGVSQQCCSILLNLNIKWLHTAGLD